jgi:AraC-type DNA-binding domain-containing proteins
MSKGNIPLSAPSKEYTFKLSSDSIPYKELIGAHVQESWEIDFIKRGYGVHIFNDITEPCVEGEIILIPPKTIHNWIIDPKSVDGQGRIESYTITFNPSTISQRLKAFPELNDCVSFFSDNSQPMEICGESAKEVKSLIMLMAQQDASFQLPIFLNILLTISKGSHKRIINTASPNNKSPKALTIIQKAYQYILNNYQHHIALEDVADFVAMNKSAFCSLFKKHYTQSFFYVLNEHRIHVACVLLCEIPQRDIADIGYSVGFNDISYFHRTFKRYKGCSPRQYRSKVKELQNL